MQHADGAVLLLPMAESSWRRWAPAGWQALANVLLARGVAVYAAGQALDGAEPLAPDSVEIDLQRGPWRVIVSDVNPLLERALGGLWPVVALAGPDAIHTDAAIPPHWVVRSPAYCSPCEQAGCCNRPDSPAVCLDWLSLRTVMQAVEAALALPARINTGDS